MDVETVGRWCGAVRGLVTVGLALMGFALLSGGAVSPPAGAAATATTDVAGAAELAPIPTVAALSAPPSEAEPARVAGVRADRDGARPGGAPTPTLGSGSAAVASAPTPGSGSAAVASAPTPGSGSAAVASAEAEAEVEPARAAADASRRAPSAVPFMAGGVLVAMALAIGWHRLLLAEHHPRPHRPLELPS